MRHGDLITVVLQHAGNARGGSRLVQTEVFLWPGNEVTGETFVANEDDRVEHRLVDEGKTWVRDHVDDESDQGKALLAHATAADRVVPPEGSIG